MSERLKIALTALAGISVFVLGQTVHRWLIDPIQEQRRLVGKIIHAVTTTDVHIETRTPEQIKEAFEALRKLIFSSIREC
jgi:hypothetical protein